MDIFGLTFVGTIDVNTVFLMVSNVSAFGAAIFARQALRASKNNAVKLDAAHIELTRNTDATNKVADTNIEIAKSVNGKLDAALDAAKTAAVVNAAATALASKDILAKLGR